MADAILRLIFQADNSQAIAGAKILSAELQRQREAQKLAFYEERARGLEAKKGIADLVVEERRREAALKQTTQAQIALAKAEENARALGARAQNARGYFNLRVRERDEVGVSGLDRQALLRGQTQGGGLAIATLREGADILTGILPQGIQRTGAIAARVLGSGGTVASGMGAIGTAAAGLTVALGAGALLGAIALAGAAFTNLSGQLEAAAKRQGEAIVLTGQIQNAINVDRATAKGLTREFDKSLSRESGGLIDTAASGKIGRGILDDVLQAAQASGKSRQSAIDRTARISSGLAGLAQATGTDTGQLSNVLGDIASRSQSVEQLRGRDVLNDLGINKVLIPELEKRGIKKLSELTQDQVFELLELSVNKTFSAETKAELAQSATGLVARLKFKLFDPNNGILSVERDLNLRTPEVESVFNSFNKSIELLLGKDGTLDQLSRIFGGVDFDAMRELRNAIEGFNKFLTDLNKLLSELNKTREAIAKIPLPFVGNVGSATQSGFNTLQSVSSIARGVNPLVTAINPAASIGASLLSSVLGALGIGAKPSFAGSMPGLEGAGLMPIANAIAVENANKPYGSDLIVANSSEYVLTPEQYEALAYPKVMQSQAIAPRTASVEVKNMNFYQQVGQDPRSLAREVIAELDAMLDFERSASFG